jgi:TP901 family phage tail tape measure protein
MQQNLSIQVAFGVIDKLTQPLNAAKAASKGLGVSVNATRQQIQALDKQTRQFEKSTQIIAKKSEEISKLREQRKELKNQTLVSDEQKEQIESLTKQISKLGRQIGTEKKQLDKIKTGFNQFGVTLKSDGDATEQLSRKTQEYTDRLRQQESQLQRVTKAQKAYDDGKKLAARMRSGGAKAAAIGGAALWGGMRLMQPGIEFDQAFSQTLANAQLERKDAEAKALREQAMQLARTTHYNAVQATEGQRALISGGMSAYNARTALPSILNMALAAHADLGSAADAGSNILDHFQLQADQAERVADVLTGTFTRSKTSLSSLNETMEYSGTIAHTMGMSLEQTAAAAAMLAKNGLTGSTAGTGLKEALKGLSSPAAAGRKALKELKIKVSSPDGALRPLPDLMAEIWKRTRRFDQQSQFTFFTHIFGTEGATAAIVLAQAAADGQFQAFEKYLKKTKGLSAKTAKEMTDNYAGDMQMLHSAWDGLWTNMETGSDAPMRKLVQRITSILQAVADWTEKHPKLTSAIMDTTLAVGSLLVVLGSVVALFGTFMKIFVAGRLALSLRAVGAGGTAAGAGLTEAGAGGGAAAAGIGAAGEAATVAEGALPAVGAEAAAAGVALTEAGASGAAAAAGIGAAGDAAVVAGGELAAAGGVWAAAAGRASLLEMAMNGLTVASKGLYGFLLLSSRLLLTWVGIPGIIIAIGEAANYMWTKLDLTDRLTELERHGSAVASSLAKVWLASTADARVAITLFDIAIKKGRELLGLEDNAQQKALRDKVQTLQGDLGAVLLPEKLKGMVNDLQGDVKNALKPPKPPGEMYGTDHWDGGGKKKKKRGSGEDLPDDHDGRLGDIVFKTLPPWLALKHGFTQPVLAANHGGIVAASRTTAPEKKTTPDIGTNVAGDINLHIHIDGNHMDRQALVHDIEQQVMTLLNKLNRQKLSSLKDRD